MSNHALHNLIGNGTSEIVSMPEPPGNGPPLVGLVARWLVTTVSGLLLLCSAISAQSSPKVVAVVIEKKRIEPTTLHLPAGRTIIIVHNGSGRASISPRLTIAGGSALQALALPGANAKGTMDVVLAPGTYVLTETGAPLGSCTITVN